MNEAASRPTQPTILWRHADFLRFWGAQGISVFGSQVSLLALPLTAVLLLDASASQMGILAAAERAPFLLIALFAGVWVDRLPRKPILVAGDIGRGLVLGTIPLAALGGFLGMPQLYLVALLVGLLTVFFDVAYQAYVPALVDRSQLIDANSKLEVTRSSADVAGPGVAGLVVQVITAPLAIALDAVSFLVSGLLISLIGRREAAQAAPQGASFWAQVREGLSVVLGSPYLRAIAACTGTHNLFSTAFDALLILFATRELKLTPAQIGIILSIGSLGALLGAFVAARLADRLGVGGAILAGACLSGLGGLAFPLAWESNALVLLTIGQFVLSLGTPIYNINQLSLRQAITPQRLQGRMNASMRFLVWGTMPIGGLIGGLLGDLLDLRPTITLAVIGAFLSVLWLVLSPVRSLKRIPEPAD